MLNILKWDLNGTLKSKKFKVVLMTMMILGALFIPIAAYNNVRQGFDGFLEGIAYINSIIYLAGSIYAGMSISSAFQDRIIQSAVMAGNSRLTVLLSKAAVYLTALVILCALPIILIGFMMSLIYGFGAQLSVEIIMYIMRVFVLSILMNMATMSICIPISFLIKSSGVSIGANIVVILLYNGLANVMLGSEKAIKLISYTSMGQSFMIFGDMTGISILKAVAVALTTIALCIYIAYSRFHLEELK